MRVRNVKLYTRRSCQSHKTDLEKPKGNDKDSSGGGQRPDMESENVFDGLLLTSIKRMSDSRFLNFQGPSNTWRV